MNKIKVFLLLSIFSLALTACSEAEQNANHANPPAPQAAAQADANANVVKVQGQMAVIPAAPQPAAPQPAAPPANVDLAKAPKIDLPVMKADFGTVKEDKKIVKNFVVKNVGKAPLNIESITPG